MSENDIALKSEGVPFGILFEEPVDEDETIQMGTNTNSMSDDDTGTYRKDTDDRDT